MVKSSYRTPNTAKTSGIFVCMFVARTRISVSHCAPSIFRQQLPEPRINALTSLQWSTLAKKCFYSSTHPKVFSINADILHWHLHERSVSKDDKTNFNCLLVWVMEVFIGYFSLAEGKLWACSLTLMFRRSMHRGSCLIQVTVYQQHMSNCHPDLELTGLRTTQLVCKSPTE